MKLTPLLFILITSTVCVTCFEPFDDKIRFDVNWAGPVSLREGQLTMVRDSYLRRCLCLRFYLKVYCASTSSWPICALSNWLIVFRFLRKNQTCFKFCVSKNAQMAFQNIFLSCQLCVAFISKSNSHSGSSINSKQAIARGSSFEAIHDININLVLVVTCSHMIDPTVILATAAVCVSFLVRETVTTTAHMYCKSIHLLQPL